MFTEIRRGSALLRYSRDRSARLLTAAAACICVAACTGAADFEAADHAKEEAEVDLTLSHEEMEK